MADRYYYYHRWIRTLMHIVIINPTSPNMVQHALSTTTHVTTIVNQEKTNSYAKHASRDDFNPFAIDLWLSSFLFQLFLYFLCLSHFSLSLTVFFSSHNVYFLLLVMHVHILLASKCHCDSSMCCCTWETFFIFSTHCSQCTFVANQFVANNFFLIFDLLVY